MNVDRFCLSLLRELITWSCFQSCVSILLNPRVLCYDRLTRKKYIFVVFFLIIRLHKAKAEEIMFLPKTICVCVCYQKISHTAGWILIKLLENTHWIKICNWFKMAATVLCSSKKKTVHLKETELKFGVDVAESSLTVQLLWKITDYSRFEV